MVKFAGGAEQGAGRAALVSDDERSRPGSPRRRASKNTERKRQSRLSDDASRNELRQRSGPCAILDETLSYTIINASEYDPF
jgi:hypothetical protein